MNASLNPQTLPTQLVPGWAELLQAWTDEQGVSRLWEGDSSLWTNADEASWIGWLGVVDQQLRSLEPLLNLRADVAAQSFSDILLLGMGGSSLCPEVLALTFGQQDGFPKLHVLDSTDPSQLLAAERKVDLQKTLVFVSSKSGTTLEPDILRRYFFKRVGEEMGVQPGDRFIAVTDPGSKLEATASQDRYRAVFYGLPEIGGRYSALSHFGMAPAAAAGLDVRDFLERSRLMVAACGDDRPPAENPGVQLGLLLGALAELGRNKLTFFASEGLTALGAWLEQLIAESTGKVGRAIIPVDLEDAGPPEVYGDDRVFVVLQLGDDAPFADRVQALEDAGQPVVRIVCEEKANLGQEFYRWEVATAVAGAVMTINPFNQPDVEASKVATRRLTDQYERTRSLPAERPFFQGEGFQLFADAPYAARLARAAGDESLAGYLRAHLGNIQPGDYLALLAYIERNEEHTALLQKMRLRIRDASRAATCLGFGPRFLHSTGQAYKGGPNTGVVIQVTSDDAVDVDVPGKDYSFSIVKAAQARGDLEVLNERARRALRVHLRDVKTGLEKLGQAVEQASAS